MTTPGDADTPPPPGHVDRPEFADGGSVPYAPDYELAAAPAFQSGNLPVGPQPKTRDSRWGLMAPIAAAIVLIGGIGILIVTSGSDEPATTNTPRIAEVRDPDGPVVESTVPGDPVVEISVPLQTSPPLIEPRTTVDDVTVPTASEPLTSESPPDTRVVDAGGPTLAQLDAALLGINDIGSGDWTEEVPDFEDVCGTVPDVAEPDARADSLFGTIILDPIGVRQISNTLVTYATSELAEQAFIADVAELEACNATTIELEGDQYRVQVNSDAFTDEQAAEFPCSDQSSFLILQLVNDDLAVPYIGQSAVSFRCGRNVTVTALATTIGIDDLNDEAFFDAAAISNTRTGDLPGS